MEGCSCEGRPLRIYRRTAVLAVIRHCAGTETEFVQRISESDGRASLDYGQFVVAIPAYMVGAIISGFRLGACEHERAPALVGDPFVHRSGVSDGVASRC